ncbi:hypothetical protein AB0E27_20335 [Streptomyces sparsogenes]|uniref:hypothetical protein n=1 Tax=Streptomyces sparsogenes TaxID=67365 RepID=UPI0033F899C5
MTTSPTSAERAALRVAHAVPLESSNPGYSLIDQVVFALGSAQLLMDPETAAELARLRPRVAELEAEQGDNDGAKAPWGRAEDGRPYLPAGAHWTDVPELVDRTVAGIQARVDQAQPGHWYTAPATETGLAPGTVRTRVDGYPRTVGQFTNVLPADLELILHAHDDLSWCLAMLAKFRARVAELEQHAAESRMSVIEDVANWLRSVGEDDAAYLVGTCDIPVSASPERMEDDTAPSQVVPVVDDVPVPTVLTERAEAELLPAVVTTSARASAARLRRLLHPLDGGVSQ